MCDKILYQLCECDVKDIARGLEINSGFSPEEMRTIKKGVESGLGECWADVMIEAIRMAKEKE